MHADEQGQPTGPGAGRPGKVTRRGLLRASLALPLAAPIVMSLEEHALLAQNAAPSSGAVKAPAAGKGPMGKIGSIEISRLICGGNLIGGYAHSRDLIYVSPLLKHYFTDEKIMETWALCEQHGINTMVAFFGDPHLVELYGKYVKQGGKMQCLAQLNPTKEDVKTCAKQAADGGAVGAFLLGNLGDAWSREGSVGRIGELVQAMEQNGLIAGVAGHELRTVKAVEDAGIKPDFYVKTLHDENYWSKRRPDQTKEVIDNYGIDNYWCMDPKETIAYMAGIKRPWIAYKVLAAGAIHPKHGFRHAFENGADFALVGMFDFQVAEDVTVVRETLAGKLNRQRPWLA
jgi:hypothetical protein